MRVFSVNAHTLLALVLAIPIGCRKGGGHDGGTPAPPAAQPTDVAAPEGVTATGSLVPGPDTVVLDEAAQAALTSVGADGTLTFDASASGLRLAGGGALASRLTPGKVIVLGVHPQAPNGLLRKVRATREEGGVVTVETDAATLAEAVQDADVSITLPLGRDGAAETLPTRVGVEPQAAPALRADDKKEGLYIGLNDLVLYDVDGDDETKNDRIVVSGNLYAGIGAVVTLKIESFSVKELTFKLQGRQTASLAVEGTGAASYKASLDVSVLKYTSIVVTIGGFPIVLIPSVGLSVGVEGAATAKFRAGVSEEAAVDLGAGYVDGEVKPIADGTLDGKTESPTLKGTGFSARAFAGVRGELAVYGVAGGSAGLEGFAKVAGELTSAPCFKAQAGLAATAALKAGLFGLTIADWEDKWELLTKELSPGGCNVGGGGGQDAQAVSYLYPEASEDDLSSVRPAYAVAPDAGLFLGRARNVDAYAMKLDTAGAVDFRRSSGTTHSETWRAAAAVGADGYALIGAATAPVVARLEPTGKVRWSSIYDYSATYDVLAAAATSDGGLVVGGALYTSDDVDGDAFLMRLDAAGAVMWAERLKGPRDQDRIHAVQVLADGSIAVAGSYGVNYSDPVIDPSDRSNTFGWVAVLSADGAVKRSRNYTAEVATSLAATSDGGLLVLGYKERMIDGSLARAPWALKLDSAGDVAWKQGFNDRVMPLSIAVADDGGALLAGIRGFTFGPDQVLEDGWLARLSPAGGVAWARRFGGSTEDGLTFVTQRADGRIVAGGYARPSDKVVKPWLLSLASSGDGSFADGSGYTSANLSGDAYTPPISTPDAALTVIPLSPVRADFGHALEPQETTPEKLAGP